MHGQRRAGVAQSAAGVATLTTRGLRIATAILLLTACQPAQDPRGSAAATVGQTTAATADPSGEQEGSAITALSALGELPVRGRAPKTGYDRDQFGPAWFDVDGNGCDTRNDVLAATLTDVVLDADCAAVTGTLLDRYSGRSEPFAPDDPAATAIDIDHVVALGDAWQKGAQQLDLPTRIQFANDPLNLIPVDASLNRQKGDGDAATWLPPDRSFRCMYVATQIAVKQRYRLWVTSAEADAMRHILDGCPAQALPDGPVPPRPTAVPDASTGVSTSPAPGTPGVDRPYDTCAQARTAGDAPVYRGEPGYSSDLDGDSDGIACE